MPKNLQQNVSDRKWPPPPAFWNFPKIHPFQRRQASLNGRGGSRNGPRWFLLMHWRCGALPPCCVSGRSTISILYNNRIFVLSHFAFSYLCTLCLCISGPFRNGQWWFLLMHWRCGASLPALSLGWLQVHFRTFKFSYLRLFISLFLVFTLLSFSLSLAVCFFVCAVNSFVQMGLLWHWHQRSRKSLESFD